jgi:energy-coupling factor transporter ATP-binding protein EcfA2
VLSWVDMTGTPKLVFVEGMPGSGKTTTAKHLAQWLPEQGIATRCFLEMADDNPIRTPGVDLMRSRHPHVRPLPDTDERGLAKDLSVYGFEQWARLAARAREGSEVLLLESRYLQNSVQMQFLDGASRQTVVATFRTVVAHVGSAPPLLVYLRPTDIRSHWQRTLDTRDAVWAQWVIRGFAGSAWARERSLTGPEAIFAFYEAWEPIALELCELHEGPLLVLQDPERDWAETYVRLQAAARG